MLEVCVWFQWCTPNIALCFLQVEHLLVVVVAGGAAFGLVCNNAACDSIIINKQNSLLEIS